MIYIQAEDLIQIIQSQTKNAESFVLGTIDLNYESGRPKVKFDGETSVSTKQYPYLYSYTPVAEDRVLLAKVRSTYIILGSIM